MQREAAEAALQIHFDSFPTPNTPTSQFGDEEQDEAQASDEQNPTKVAQEQDNAEPGQEQDPPEVTHQHDRKSETSSTRRRLDMFAVGLPVSRASPEASYDREGGFWKGFNRAGPTDAPSDEKKKADDPNKDKPDPDSQHRTFKGLKLLPQSLKRSKKIKDDPVHSVLPPPDPEVAGSKITRPRASWKSRWHLARHQQRDMTTVYPCKAEDRHVAAADSPQPSQVLEQWETVPGDYLTHTVLPDSPPRTPTDDHHHDGPNESPDNYSPGPLCGLCATLLSFQATAASTRPVTSTANARESTQREQTEHRSAHDTVVGIELARIHAGCPASGSVDPPQG
ncbi:hypothetical protein PAXRUDRAFT_168651 [Paxillus rubicundulus Ve08.2h10]|uniref:Uncharacterized protein n=1 Tax=Paxillus rubicundulus Ve08.2h10 TaxID=930991 RepID=A0A0D0D8U5_9AGAM|nr:hypothetical protein PAXRUDRAFT_168651 [Paxillus rubicundulus Ve08.2h10]